MKEIRYIIKDELGIHARPAGLLVKTLIEFAGDVQVGSAQKKVNGKRIMAIMGLGIKQGDEFIVTFDGPGEEEAAQRTEIFLREHL